MMHEMWMSMFNFIGHSRSEVLLQGSQHHPRTGTTIYYNNHWTNMPNHHSKLRCFKDTPKRTLLPKLTLKRIILFYFKLGLQQQHIFLVLIKSNKITVA